MSDTVERLQNLLITLSDGEWEHGLGITIESLDNPGWVVRVALLGTPFEDPVIDRQCTDRTDKDWVDLQVLTEKGEPQLVCTCGPKNLTEALNRVFSVLDSAAR